MDISDDMIKRTIGIPLQNALEQMTGVNDISLIDEMKAAFHTKADEVMTAFTTLYPSVIPLFTLLADCGAVIGIVSNKFSFRLYDVMERYAIQNYVSVVIGCDDVSAHKPSPDGLLLAIERLGISKNDAIYIGDSIIDSLTAKNAGVDFAAVTTGTTPADAFLQEPHVAIVSDLSQLQEALR
jgi:phosphoglycolate phosphatase